MPITIDDFSSIFQNVDNELKKEITLFFVYNDLIDENSSTTVSQNNGKNVLFITEDDKVYAFGDNSRGCLGVKPFNPTPKPQIINEICNKQIINFYNGTHHVLAQTSNNEIYGWGCNKFGQLGVYPSCADPLTPQRNKFLSGKFIQTISCGDEHSLALTKSGDVYSWGNNKYGQVGNGRSDNFISRPANLSLNDAFHGLKINAISCGSDHSIVLTNNKTVFSWGLNDFGQLGHDDLENRNSPCPLSLENVVKISCGQKSSMVITENGFLYIFGRSYLDGTNMKQVSPIMFTNAITFKDVVSHIYFDIFVALSTDGYCYEFGNVESDYLKIPNKTEDTSLLEYYANVHEITLIAIDSKKINEEVIKEERLISNPDSVSNTNPKSVAKIAEHTQQPSQNFERKKDTTNKIHYGDKIKNTLVGGKMEITGGTVSFSGITQAGNSNK